MDLLPDDVIELLTKWISLFDCFDETKMHSSLQIIKDEHNQYQILKTKRKSGWYSTAIGTQIITKGMKKEWIIEFKKVKSTLILLGIIENSMVNINEMIDDFTNGQYNGWGIYLSCSVKYHGQNSEQPFEYASQFKLRNGNKIKIILDLSNNNKNTGNKGSLAYIYDADIDKEILTTGTFSNIAYDDIDVEKEYRFAIAMHASSLSQIAFLQ